MVNWFPVDNLRISVYLQDVFVPERIHSFSVAKSVMIIATSFLVNLLFIEEIQLIMEAAPCVVVHVPKDVVPDHKHIPS